MVSTLQKYITSMGQWIVHEEKFHIACWDLPTPLTSTYGKFLFDFATAAFSDLEHFFLLGVAKVALATSLQRHKIIIVKINVKCMSPTLPMFEKACTITGTNKVEQRFKAPLYFSCSQRLS